MLVIVLLISPGVTLKADFILFIALALLFEVACSLENSSNPKPQKVQHPLLIKWFGDQKTCRYSHNEIDSSHQVSVPTENVQSNN